MSCWCTGVSSRRIRQTRSLPRLVRTYGSITAHWRRSVQRRWRRHRPSPKASGATPWTCGRRRWTESSHRICAHPGTWSRRRVRQPKRQGQRMNRLPIAGAGWRRCGRSRQSGCRPCGCSHRTWHSGLPRGGGIGRDRTEKRWHRPQRATMQRSDCSVEGRRLKWVSPPLKDRLRPNYCNGPGRLPKRGGGRRIRI
jgi:hypothetical protein